MKRLFTSSTFLKRFLTTLACISLIAGITFTQSNSKSVAISSERTGNYVSDYSENLAAIAQVVNSKDAIVIEEAKSNLKIFYEDKFGTPLDDTQLGAMLAGSQANYDTWMEVYQEVRTNSTKKELAVLRSVITNIKMKM